MSSRFQGILNTCKDEEPKTLISLNHREQCLHEAIEISAAVQVILALR